MAKKSALFQIAPDKREVPFIYQIANVIYMGTALPMTDKSWSNAFRIIYHGNGNMVIYLKSGGKLREKLKPDVDQYTRRIEVEAGLSLKEILERFQIPFEQIAFAYVGGNFKRLDYHPEDGQVITLQPPVSGG